MKPQQPALLARTHCCDYSERESDRRRAPNTSSTRRSLWASLSEFDQHVFSRAAGHVVVTAHGYHSATASDKTIFLRLNSNTDCVTSTATLYPSVISRWTDRISFRNDSVACRAGRDVLMCFDRHWRRRGARYQLCRWYLARRSFLPWSDRIWYRLRCGISTLWVNKCIGRTVGWRVWTGHRTGFLLLLRSWCYRSVECDDIEADETLCLECCYNNTSAGPHRSPASNRLSDSDEVYSVVVQPWHSPLFETKSIHPLKAWFPSNAVATRTDFLVRDVVRRRRAFRGLKTSSEKIGRVVRRVRKLGRGSRCV